MARRKKNNLVWVWVVGGILLLRNVARGGVLRSLFLSPSQLAEMYSSLVTSSPGINYTVNGKPWHVDLASVTRDYAAVKSAYATAYGKDLTTDLLSYFDAKGYIALSEYVAALWENQQVMS